MPVCDAIASFIGLISATHFEIRLLIRHVHLDLSSILLFVLGRTMIRAQLTRLVN